MINGRGGVPIVLNWSERQNPTTVTPYTQRFFFKDVGVGGSEWYSDGTRWLSASNKNNGASRPTMLIFGNSIAAQSCRETFSNTTSFASLVKPNSTTATLTNGGVAALGLVVNDYVSIGLCSRQSWIVKVTGINGEVLTLEKPTPAVIRSGVSGGIGISKVTAPNYWFANHRMNTGHISLMNALLGAPCHLLNGYGYSGALLNDFIADLDTNLKFYKPDFVYLQVLENDVVTAGQTANTIIKNIKIAADLCIKNNATPIFSYCLPRIEITAASEFVPIFDAVNGYLSTIESDIPGSYSINPGNIYLNSSTGGRIPVTDAVLGDFTQDGVHPNFIRYLDIALSKKAELERIVGTKTDISRNLFGNNVELAGSVAVTVAGGIQVGSVAPTGTTITASNNTVVTTSKTAENKLRVVFGISPGAASDTSSTVCNIIQTITTPTTLSASNNVKAVVDIDVLSIAKISSIKITLTYGGITTSNSFGSDLTTSKVDFSGKLTVETAAIPFKDPAATTATIAIMIRPSALASPASAAVNFNAVINAIGLEFGYGEVY